MCKESKNQYSLYRRFLLKVSVMKFTFLLMMFLCLNVHASVLAQRLSIEVVGQPIQAVLGEIKDKTGYDFLFNNNILNEVKPVTLHLENVSLEQVLDACLKGQPLTYEIAESTVLIKRKSAAEATTATIAQQTRSITGTIQNSNGEPLSNVTIRNARTGYSFSSNEDGSFEVPAVNTNDALRFSLIGYAPYQLIVTNYDVQRIVLESEDQNIEEVVVVGYGTQRRESVTGSVAQINSE